MLSIVLHLAYILGYLAIHMQSDGEKLLLNVCNSSKSSWVDEMEFLYVF